MREAFKQAYSRIYKPLAYILVALAIVPQFAPVPNSVTVGALCTLGFIILASIFSIEEDLRIPGSEERFREFYDAATEIREAVMARASRQGVRVQALGMSMGHAWTFISGLLDSLAMDNNIRNVRVWVAMLDPDWDQLPRLNPTWPDRTRIHRESMLQYFSDHAALVNKRRWEFELRLYHHTPNWHGICLDGEVLFLSTCSWRNGRLVGGENEYERFTRGEGPRSDRAFELYESWFASTDGFVVYHDVAMP
jgi:hypothetical protein